MEYLVGIFLLALIWLGLALRRTDLVWPMCWSGLLYVFMMSCGFVLVKLLWPNMSVEHTVVPGYWNPDTLFDLGRRTGGYAVEDALYGFFTGGIASALYEEFLRKRLSKRHVPHRPHVAFLCGAFAGGIAAAYQIQLIWSLIAFAAVGAAVVLYERRDLWMHMFVGGGLYLLVYTLFFLVFMGLFPGYIERTYSFQNFVGLAILGIPLEEYLFAYTFGMFWSPVYQYTHEIKS